MFLRISILILSVLSYSCFYILFFPGWLHTDDTPITTAIKTNDLVEFKSLLSTDDIEIKDGSGHPPLSIAVDEVNINFVNLLLEKGANPNARSDFNDEPIIYKAATSVCYPKFNRSKETAREITKILIKYGADVNLRTASGESAILWAAKCGDSKLASILAKSGANVNVLSKRGIPPLHQAIYESRRSKSYETIEVLVAAGANTFAKDYDEKYGKSALDLAKEYGDKNLKEILDKSNNNRPLTPYSNEGKILTYKGRRIESILYRYGIKIPANIINYVTEKPIYFLIFPTIIALIFGIIRKDKPMIAVAVIQPPIIIIGFVIMIFIGLSGS